jgi:hypothetical protein
VGVRAGSQGWTDAQEVVSLLLLNLAGGDCVDDLRVLEGDDGFARLMRRVETHGLPLLVQARGKILALARAPG